MSHDRETSVAHQHFHWTRIDKELTAGVKGLKILDNLIDDYDVYTGVWSGLDLRRIAISDAFRDHDTSW